MRARSKTIYAKQSPFKATTAELEPKPTIPVAPEVSKIHIKRNSIEFDKLFEDFGPTVDCHMKDSFSGDYHSSADTCSTANDSLDGSSRSRGVSNGSCDGLFDDEDDMKTDKLLRAMVIGAKGTDKYSLVNTICPCSALEENSPRMNDKSFDLITRKVEKITATERYHFWTKEAGSQAHKALLNVYYKTCSVFFLIYDEDRRESFDCLSEEIQTIKEANPNKDILLVLVNNRKHDDNTMSSCKVTQEEAKQFQEKHNIKLYLESDKVEEVRDLLSSLAK